MPEFRPSLLSASVRLLWLFSAVVMLLSGCASQVTGTGGQATTGIGPETDDMAPQVVTPVPPLTPEQQQMLSLAEAAAERQEWAMAADTLNTLLQLRPDHPRALARLAWVRQQQGDIREAEALYRQALMQDPADALTVNNLALLVQADGYFQQAQALLTKGLEYTPDAPALHFNLAVVSELYLLDLQTALAHYRRYQQLAEGDNPQVAGWIADLERRLR
ncbi:Tetratricopeptide repeat-containing protein [Marinobacter mobilis]|uniref:Tetratricopeptide repeat-containing protein n=2 Tax=Marinobacter mobilis TaxID=488533 RepID=A0A1H2UZ13_9GAMM|nr:Tetratricopeptide repeat-containing protein [Marinobacter mobilis]